MQFAFDLETVIKFSELFIHVPNRSETKVLCLCPMFSCLHEVLPLGIYIPMETLHLHLKSEISVQRIKDYDEPVCCEGQGKYGGECVNFTLYWTNSKNRAIDKGQTHQFQEGRIYVGLNSL